MSNVIFAPNSFFFTYSHLEITLKYTFACDHIVTWSHVEKFIITSCNAHDFLGELKFLCSVKVCKCTKFRFSTRRGFFFFGMYICYRDSFSKQNYSIRFQKAGGTLYTSSRTSFTSWSRISGGVLWENLLRHSITDQNLQAMWSMYTFILYLSMFLSKFWVIWCWYADFVRCGDTLSEIKGSSSTFLVRL